MLFARAHALATSSANAETEAHRQLHDELDAEHARVQADIRRYSSSASSQDGGGGSGAVPRTASGSIDLDALAALEEEVHRPLAERYERIERRARFRRGDERAALSFAHEERDRGRAAKAHLRRARLEQRAESQEPLVGGDMGKRYEIFGVKGWFHESFLGFISTPEGRQLLYVMLKITCFAVAMWYCHSIGYFWKI